MAPSAWRHRLEGVLVFLTGSALALLGVRRLALAGALTALLGGGWIAVDYSMRIGPTLTGDSVPLRVLWLNLLKDNTTQPEQIADALRRSGADLIVLAEAAPAYQAVPALSDLYPHRQGCTDPTRCELLILSRHPMGPVKFGDMLTGPERLARFTLELPEGPHPTIVAVHRIKPWYLGLTGGENAWMRAVLSGGHNRPLLVVGDFNASPWSRRMWQLGTRYGLRHPTWPIATWPAWAGRFGVQIDHVLTRGAIGAKTIIPWEVLLSNHRGLLADLRVFLHR